MRITGGGARSISLKSTNHSILRPATDGLRETVFSAMGPLVVNTYFLDLFAGTGAYGLEALSRGARGGIFVENHPQIAQCLQSNLASVSKSLSLPTTICKVMQVNAFKWKPPLNCLFDLVFIDAPYTLLPESEGVFFESLLSKLTLHPEARVLLELPASYPTPVLKGYVHLRRLGKSSGQHPNICMYQLEHAF